MAKIAHESDVMQTHGMATREALASGALTAGWHVWAVDQKDVLSQPREDVAGEPDAVICLRDILALRERTNAGVEKSIVSLLADTEEASRIANLYGIKFMEDKALAVAPAHRGLKNALQRRTKWGSMDIRPLLLQIPETNNSGDKQLRFGGPRHRYVSIPPSTLAHYGIIVDAPSQAQLGRE